MHTKNGNNLQNEVWMRELSWVVLGWINSISLLQILTRNFAQQCIANTVNKDLKNVIKFNN